MSTTEVVATPNKERCTLSDMESLGQRVAKRREELGLSQEQIGAACGVSQQAIQQLEDGAVRRPRYVVELAAALNWPLETLMDRKTTNGAPPPSVTALPVPSITDMPQDVPILGIGLGGREGSWFTLDNGKIVDRARRPPGLMGAVGIFAIFVQGDSMAPKYEPGDLVFVHPGRPPTPGCDVLIELHPEKPGEPGHAAIKRLVRRAGGKVILAQLNPRKEGGKGLEFDQAKVLRLYRILRTSELFGV